MSLSVNLIKRQLLLHQTLLRRLSTKTGVQVSEQAYYLTFPCRGFCTLASHKVTRRKLNTSQRVTRCAHCNSTQEYSMKISHMELIDNILGLPFQPLAHPNSSYKMSGKQFCEPTPYLPDQQPSSHDILVTS